MKILFLCLSLSLFLFSCVTNLGTSSYKPNKRAITIMTYNVENLFDTKDDKDKQDETFLPLSTKKGKILRGCDALSKPWYIKSCKNKDWTEENLKIKMARLADVILKAKEGGPEIIFFQEVENRFVIEALRKKFLKGKGYYPVIHIENSDRRGIDVAILTKLRPISRPQLFPIVIQAKGGLEKYKNKWKNSQRRLREILKITLALPDKKPLHLFGVHFSSQSLPAEARRQSISAVNKLTSYLRSHGEMVVVAGDFNITVREENLYKKDLGSKWIVSHHMGCDTCKGTYYYHPKRQWSFLDNILFSPSMKKQAPWVMLPSSVRVFNKSIYQINRYGSPAKFRAKSTYGVSDHWPMLVDIIPRKIKVGKR